MRGGTTRHSALNANNKPNVNEAFFSARDLPPEHPEVRLRINEHGAIQAVSALRWGNAGEKTFQYIPFGGDVHAERRFGDLVLPSTLSVGWWFDTPRYAPFFRAEINAVTPTP